jgi:surface antigen
MRFVLHTFGVFAQAFKSLSVPAFRAAALGAAALAVQACSMTGKGLDDASVSAIAIVDDTTPVITNDPFNPVENAEGAERDRLLDEDTIRHAVTSADLGARKSGPLSWANQSTGSSGVITEIEQRKVAGQTCRSFSATRNAYDGVTLYKGDLCLDRRTGWWTRILKPLGLGADA